MSAENFRIGAGSLSIAGEDVGLTTEEGMVVSYEPDVHLHLSGKYGNTPVKASLIGKKLTLEVWIAEHTLQNILDAFAGAGGSSTRVKFGGVAGSELVGKELVLTPFDNTPSWTFRKAIPVSNVDTNYKVNDERIIHVTFQALVDLDAVEDENLAFVS
jgi:hypothetical protein